MNSAPSLATRIIRPLAVLACIAAIWAPSGAKADPAKDLEDDLRRLKELKGQDDGFRKAELARVREEREQLEARLEAARKRLTNTFELDERKLIPRPQRISKTMRLWQQRRDAVKFSMLQFRDKWAGAIRSGAALNFFLDECGRVAFEHELVRRVAQPGDANPGDGQPIERVALDFPLPKEVTRHIVHEKGLMGNKLSGRLNQGPLNLNWPRVMRDDQFKTQRTQIERLRDELIAGLKKGDPVNLKTADELLKQAEKLYEKVRAETKKQIQQKSNGASRIFGPYQEAVRFTEILVASAYRLVEAGSLADVTIEEFDGKNVEDLLAYMYRNNLHFQRTDVNGESAYFLLFEQIARYYVDLHALRMAIEEDEKTLARTRQDEAEMRDIAFGRSMDAMQKVSVIEHVTDAFSSAMKAIEADQYRRATGR